MHVGRYVEISHDVFVSPHVDLVLGDATYLGPGVHIIGEGRVEFGDYCKVHAGCFINAGAGGWVKFGHNCWFGEQTVLDGAGGLTGGNNVGAGIGSQLYTHIAHGDTIEGCRFESRKGMTLEDDVWFVGQCFVSPVHAGAKSVALLGSVITKDMEPNHIYAGNPAADITDKVGAPWIVRSSEEKLSMLNQRFDQYCELFPDRAEIARRSIKVVVEYPESMQPDVTYFNVASRRYTKRFSDAEWRFMSWLTSYKGRFMPEEVDHG